MAELISASNHNFALHPVFEKQTSLGATAKDACGFDSTVYLATNKTPNLLIKCPCNQGSNRAPHDYPDTLLLLAVPPQSLSPRDSGQLLNTGHACLCRCRYVV